MWRRWPRSASAGKPGTGSPRTWPTGPTTSEPEFTPATRWRPWATARGRRRISAPLSTWPSKPTTLPAGPTSWNGSCASAPRAGTREAGTPCVTSAGFAAGRSARASGGPDDQPRAAAGHRPWSVCRATCGRSADMTGTGAGSLVLMRFLRAGSTRRMTLWQPLSGQAVPPPGQDRRRAVPAAPTGPAGEVPALDPEKVRSARSESVRRRHPGPDRPFRPERASLRAAEVAS